MDPITLLKSGGLVIIPTETVYGLAASIEFPEAIDRIYTLKKRPRSKPLTVHIATFDQLFSLISELPPGAREHIDAHWPGPLTLIFQGIGVRMPNHPQALEIIRETGPLVATSVNISGQPSPADPASLFDVPIVRSTIPMSGIPSKILSYDNGTWTTIRQCENQEKESSLHPQTALSH